MALPGAVILLAQVSRSGGAHGFKAKGLFQHSLGHRRHRPRNRDSKEFLWPTANIQPGREGLNMAVGQTDSFRIIFQGRCPWLH